MPDLGDPDEESGSDDEHDKEAHAQGVQQAHAAMDKASASNPQASDDKGGTKENAHAALEELRR